jgi:hypothetical protein
MRLDETGDSLVGIREKNVCRIVRNLFLSFLFSCFECTLFCIYEKTCAVGRTKEAKEKATRSLRKLLN